MKSSKLRRVEFGCYGLWSEFGVSTRLSSPKNKSKFIVTCFKKKLLKPSAHWHVLYAKIGSVAVNIYIIYIIKRKTKKKWLHNET